MIILDTHAWIWWSSDPSKLGKRSKSQLRKAKTIGVSAISCWEVAMLVERGRIEIDRPALDWIESALATPRVELVPLTPAIAVTSTQLGNFHGDPADRLIAATAIVHAARLITQDERMTECALLDSIW